MNKSTCKHYNGDYQNTHCKAGVCYKDVTTGTDAEPGSAFRKPCVNWAEWYAAKGEEMSPTQKVEWGRRGSCDKREIATDEQTKAEEAMMVAHFEKVALVTKFVSPLRKLNTGDGYQGVHECPACNGRLHVSIAGCNGHARVKCESEDCVNWIE